MAGRGTRGAIWANRRINVRTVTEANTSNISHRSILGDKCDRANVAHENSPENVKAESPISGFRQFGG